MALTVSVAGGGSLRHKHRATACNYSQRKLISLRNVYKHGHHVPVVRTGELLVI